MSGRTWPVETVGNSPILRYPGTWAQWQELYSWLFDAYVCEPYTPGDIKALHLFRALDDDSKEIAAARRLIQDAKFIVDTDAASMISGGWTLEAQEKPDLSTGEGIWARSKVDEQALSWALRLAMLGDLHIEAVRDRDLTTRLICYHPSMVRVDYDTIDASRLERAVIQVRFSDPPQYSPDGAETPGQPHFYQRILTKTHWQTWLDGQVVEEETGYHGLGAVPLVHVPFAPVIEPEHGLSAAHSVYQAIAFGDSLLAQGGASSARYADPKIVVKGARLDTGSDVRFGRYFHGLSDKASMEYLETSLSGVQTALEMLTIVRQFIKEAPEFLFSDSGANASGSSLNFRSTAFVAKMDPVKRRLLGALARVTQYAAELQAGVAHEPDRPMFKVESGPILPVNKAEELANILRIHEAGGLATADLVRHLQRLGYVDLKHDPEQYAGMIRDDASALVGAITSSDRTAREASRQSADPEDDPEALAE